jgi:hypothetical protein
MQNLPKKSTATSTRRFRQPDATTLSRAPLGPASIAVHRLHGTITAFGERRLTWDDSVDLCKRVGVSVTLGRSRYDAILLEQGGRARILVDERVYRPAWGVFCVVHELAHRLLHPGDREYYLGSPGWESKIESQANLVALHALWPRLSFETRVQKIRINRDHNTVDFTLSLPPEKKDAMMEETPIGLQRFDADLQSDATVRREQ